MQAGFDVDGEEVGPGADEGLDVALGFDDHQVDIERQPRALPDGLDDGRSDGDVRHEAAVHDVHVKLVGAACLDARDRVAKRGEVGGEDARRDLHASADLTLSPRPSQT